jgi:choline kinase
MIQTERMEKLPQSTNLKVVILAAGKGTRMGRFSDTINKALIPYNNKPLISHIFDAFPNASFVVACGHKGDQVKSYINLVHSDKNVWYVDIDDYCETRTGPATTLLKCAETFNGPFMWISCDTLFNFKFDNILDHNWIATYPINSSLSSDYTWIRKDENKIIQIENKIPTQSKIEAFIGLMYVHDRKFIDNLKAVNATEMYEGFNGLDFNAYTVTDWKDFGTYDKWHELNSKTLQKSFEKPDELFYADNGKIIKYSTSSVLTESKYKRSIINPACLPSGVTRKDDFLAYDFVMGNTLYNEITPKLFSKFLKWCETTVWIKPEEDNNTQCMPYFNDEFYGSKTNNRIKLFNEKYPKWKQPKYVNGINVKAISTYFKELDFDLLSNVYDRRFIHGDMQFDNIIYDCMSGKFTVIDWRPSFAGDTYGDLYYDLAKMYGGIMLDYSKVKQGDIRYTEINNKSFINFLPIQNADEYVTILKDWTLSHNLSWRKVEILLPLIYLNMAPLHTAPMDKYLIALSKYYFSKL